MKTMKVKELNDIPKNYTGIIMWNDGGKEWFKNGEHHREDGPARIYINNIISWWLDGKIIWYSYKTFDLTNLIILSKEKHSEYPTVQIWKVLDKDKVYEQIIIPGMEEFIIE